MRNKSVQMSLEDIYSFFKDLPDMHPSTFLGDASFDSYDIYSTLKKEFGFTRAIIPMNQRNSKKIEAFDKSDIVFNEVGTPICRKSNKEFQLWGKSGGKNRSLRFKRVCPKSVRVLKSSNRVSACETPCTYSAYGRCVYTYERIINLLKESFTLSENRSFRSVSLKTDLYLSGIVQLIAVILGRGVF